MLLINNHTVLELMLEDGEFRDIVFDIAAMSDQELAAEREKFATAESEDPHCGVLKKLLDRGRAATYRDMYRRLTRPKAQPQTP